MLDRQRIFDECLEKHVGVSERWGVATVTMLTDAFACMRSRLEESKASDEDRSTFVDVIVRAIQGDPALTKYDRDKGELQKVLRFAFEATPYEPTKSPMLAPKISFLSRVRFWPSN